MAHHGLGQDERHAARLMRKKVYYLIRVITEHGDEEDRADITDMRRAELSMCKWVIRHLAPHHERFAELLKDPVIFRSEAQVEEERADGL